MLSKRMDTRKHFAHQVIRNGETKLIHAPTASQLAAILTKPRHFPQWQACAAGILNNKVATTEGASVRQRGGYRQGCRVESRRPVRGVCRRLGEPRPEQDIDLIPDDPSRRDRTPGLGWRTPVRVVDGSGPTEKDS